MFTTDNVHYTRYKGQTELYNYLQHFYRLADGRQCTACADTPISHLRVPTEIATTIIATVRMVSPITFVLLTYGTTLLMPELVQAGGKIRSWLKIFILFAIRKNCGRSERNLLSHTFKTI
jgi:hypothetical protein